jgi:hypothetical protein
MSDMDTSRPINAESPPVWNTGLPPAALEQLVSGLLDELLPMEEGAAPVPYILDASEPEQIANAAIHSLRENGVVVLNNLVSPEQADAIAVKLNQKIAPIRADLGARKTGETADYLIQLAESGPLIGYVAVSSHNKAVFNIRTRHDQGMVDIFNVDKLFPGGLPEADPMQAEFLCRLLDQATGLSYEIRNLNAYLNTGIAVTRGFHIDSFTPQAKAFLYLTDVSNEADGPHFYVLGSHRDKRMQQLNKRMNSLVGIDYVTEMRLFNRRRVVSLTGSRGTVILSFQSGAHRGGPQLDGHERLVLVQNFLVPGT